MLRRKDARSLCIFRILKALVFIGVGMCLFLSNLAYATEVVQIDRPKIRLSIGRGKSGSGVINVSNRASEPKKIKAYLEDWVYYPKGDGSKEFRPAGTTELSAASWINFVPSDFVVPAHGTFSVNYTVRVPEDAKGGYYAILFFENLLGEPETIEREMGVVVPIAVRIGALFYIEAEGTINREANLENIKLQKKDEDELEISADFINKGNVDITTKGSFYIIDENGMVYGRGKFNNVYTFPNYKARLYATCKEPIPQGTYDLIITLEIGGTSTLVEEVKMRVTKSNEIYTY